MIDDEKIMWLTNLENLMLQVDLDVVNHVLLEHGAETLEDLDPSQYQDVFNTLFTLALN